MKRFLKENKVIIFIILLGFILRFYKIKERFSFGLEQSAMLWRIAKIFTEKKLTLIGMPLLHVKSNLFQPPFLLYILALPLKIFNFNPLALEVIFTLIGVLVIPIIYSAANKIFGQQTAFIVALIYSFNASLIKFDKTLWGVTPIIITSSLVILFFNYLLTGKRKNCFHLFVIGCLIGLGFSFHSQIIISLFAFSLIFLKTKGFKKTIFFFIGVFLFLSPLFIFNLRHNFLMITGLKNIFHANQVGTQEDNTLSERLNNGLKAFADLDLQISQLSFIQTSLLGSALIFVLAYLAPAFFIYQKSKKKKEKLWLSYFLICCFIGFIGLAILNQGFYSTTSFYLWFLIPMILIIWSRFLLLVTKKNKLIAMVIIIVFSLVNLRLTIEQGPGNYQKKLEIINYIFKNAPKKEFSLKFIGKDTLSYDYLFFYRAPFYNRQFSDLNLMEEWHEGQADFYIVSNRYNWQEDQYQFLTATQITDFQDVKLIIK